MSYTPYQHTGDFGLLDKPPLCAAMRDTRHAFAAMFDEGRGWYATHDAGWILQIRKSDSIAAFTQGTLDDDPGIGAGGDPGGQINGWLACDARSQIDQPDRWEMTVYLWARSTTGRGRRWNNALPTSRRGAAGTSAPNPARSSPGATPASRTTRLSSRARRPPISTAC